MDNFEEKKTIDVYVATHKKVDIKLPSYCKLIQVNSKINDKIPNYLYDDEGENISEKNYCYSELTALYSLWKNSSANIKGLYHYRRYFYKGDTCKYMSRRIIFKKDIAKNCLTDKQINDYLSENDAIVEIPYFPYPRTVREDLLLYSYQDDIAHLSEVIKKYYPEYFNVYNEIMTSKHISYCNMIITTDKILNDYCKWLFDVLAHCEEVCNISNYDTQHKRIYGYFSEVLMNVYLQYNSLKVKLVPMVTVYEFMSNIRLKRMKFIHKFKYFICNLTGIRIDKFATIELNAYDEYKNSCKNREQNK